MVNGNSFSGGDQDLIGSATSEVDVITALARRGCPDLTSKLDSAACSSLPRNGGGYCDVYQGRLNSGRHVAIKSLRLYERPGKDNEKEKLLKRAARELYYWSKLKHPNILPLMGLAIFRGHLSMVSEWMTNGSLMAYISLNPNADRTGLCIGVCAGLSHIHANKTVHGDIKAANIMVSCSGRAMIADFGNSQLKDLTLKFTNTTSSSLSVRWAAPELLSSEDDDSQVSKESDVYAYGMTVLETITGKVPFDEFSERKVLTMVGLQSQTPARPEVGISDEIWAVLQHCWRKEKSARPDIRSVEKRLRDIYFWTWVEAKRQVDVGTDYFKMTTSTMPHLEPKSADAWPDDPERDYGGALRGLSKLVEEYARDGQIAEAESLGAEVVAVQKQLLGEDHPDVLQNMHLLVLIYEKQDKLAEAGSLGFEAVAIMKRVLGEDHPLTLQSMKNLVAIYWKQGRLAEAGSLGLDVVSVLQRVLGESHPDTLQSLSNLAIIYGQGQLAEADLLGAKVVAVMKRVLGEEHPATLHTMHMLVLIYEQQDQLEEAESLGVEAMAVLKRVLGEDHPTTLQSMHILAVIYERQGRLAEAESLGIEVTTTMKRVLGEDHSNTLESMSTLAVAYERQDRLAEAEALVAEVLAARQRILGKYHWDATDTMSWLLRIYQARGQQS